MGEVNCDFEVSHSLGKVETYYHVAFYRYSLIAAPQSSTQILTKGPAAVHRLAILVFTGLTGFTGFPDFSGFLGFTGLEGSWLHHHRL